MGLAALLLLPQLAGAPTPTPTPPRTTASASVGYVLVPFVVTDLKGRAVPNLSKGDVTLLVDGASVAFDLFERSDDAPVSFTLLLDGSGSMGLLGKMDGARAAVRQLLERRRPGDDFALHVFARGEVKEVVPFTQDAAAVRSAVDAVVPFGRTAFFDALAKMPDKSLLGRNGARAIVLLTDGLDNASSLTKDDLTTLLEGIDVPVYALGLRAPGAPVDPAPGRSAESLLNLDLLGHLARSSGGRVAIVTEPARLAEAIDGIERDLRAQYLLGFSPTGRGGIKPRKIALKLKGPARVVRVRAGYRGTEPPLVGASGPAERRESLGTTRKKGPEGSRR